MNSGSLWKRCNLMSLQECCTRLNTITHIKLFSASWLRMLIQHSISDIYYLFSHSTTIFDNFYVLGIQQMKRQMWLMPVFQLRLCFSDVLPPFISMGYWKGHELWSLKGMDPNTNSKPTLESLSLLRSRKATMHILECNWDH